MKPVSGCNKLPLDAWWYRKKGQRSHEQNRIFLHMGKFPFPYKFCIIGFYKAKEPNALLVDVHPTHGRNYTRNIALESKNIIWKCRTYSWTIWTKTKSMKSQTQFCFVFIVTRSLQRFQLNFTKNNDDYYFLEFPGNSWWNLPMGKETSLSIFALSELPWSTKLTRVFKSMLMIGWPLGQSEKDIWKPTSVLYKTFICSFAISSFGFDNTSCWYKLFVFICSEIKIWPEVNWYGPEVDRKWTGSNTFFIIENHCSHCISHFFTSQSIWKGCNWMRLLMIAAVVRMMMVISVHMSVMVWMTLTSKMIS